MSDSTWQQINNSGYLNTFTVFTFYYSTLVMKYTFVYLCVTECTVNYFHVTSCHHDRLIYRSRLNMTTNKQHRLPNNTFTVFTFYYGTLVMKYIFVYLCVTECTVNYFHVTSWPFNLSISRRQCRQLTFPLFTPKAFPSSTSKAFDAVACSNVPTYTNIVQR